MRQFILTLAIVMSATAWGETPAPTANTFYEGDAVLEICTRAIQDCSHKIAIEGTSYDYEALPSIAFYLNPLVKEYYEASEVHGSEGIIKVTGKVLGYFTIENVCGAFFCEEKPVFNILNAAFPRKK